MLAYTDWHTRRISLSLAESKYYWREKEFATQIRSIIPLPLIAVLRKIVQKYLGDVVRLVPDHHSKANVTIR